jgi:hypothetical protein
MAPRGSAKSSIATQAYPLYCAVHGLELYIQIFSDTMSQACALPESVKVELESNEALARDYPGVAGEGPVWQQDRIRLRNGVLLQALGTGSKVRGRKNRQSRATLQIADDIENEEHVTSAVRRERVWRWFNRAVLEAGTPETNVLVLGTTLHRECVPLRLAGTGGWRASTFRSIESWPERMDLWAEWERVYCDPLNAEAERDALAFYAANRAEMDRGAEVLWPEHEPLYTLMCKREAGLPSSGAADAS